MDLADSVREKLSKLVKKYGKSLFEDRTLCEGLLRDECAKYKLEINLLIRALEESIPSELIKKMKSLNAALVLKNLANRLQKNQGLDRVHAEWSVLSWAVALEAIPNAQSINLQQENTSSKPHEEALEEQPPLAKSSQKKSSLVRWIVLGIGACVIIILLFIFLTPRYGKLNIVSNPPGANIYLNNEDVGLRTPTTITRLDPGNYSLKLKKKGYVDWEGVISIRKGITARKDVQLEGSTARIEVSSDPLGAIIILDNKKTGYTTDKVISQITPGIHKIKLEKEGYEDWIVNIDVSANESYSINATLRRKEKPKSTSVKEIERVIYRWRETWQLKDLNGYMSLLTYDFTSKDDYSSGVCDYYEQQEQKAKTFRAYSYISVDINDLNINVNGDYATASFLQTYNSSGYWSKGKSVLTLRKEGGQWKIFKERFYRYEYTYK